MSIGIGDTLRDARRREGTTLTDAAADTRIRESYLAALEEENFSVLGGDVYAKGFLKSYARFLGLDPEPLLETYRNHYQVTDEGLLVHGSRIAPAPVEGRSRGNSLLLLGVLVVAVLTVVGFFSDDDVEGGAAVAPDPVPATTAPAPDDEGAVGESGDGAPDGEQETAAPAPTPTTTPTPSVLEEVNLDFAVDGGESWVRVVVDGAQQFEGILDDGFSERYSADDAVSLRIGDAAVVDLAINGRDLGDIGDPGEVVVVTCEVGAPRCQVEVVA